MRAVPTCWARTGPALSGVGGDGAGRGAGRGAGGVGGRRSPSPDAPLLAIILTPTAHLLRWGSLNPQNGDPFFFFFCQRKIIAAIISSSVGASPFGKEPFPYCNHHRLIPDGSILCSAPRSAPTQRGGGPRLSSL